MTSFAPGRWLHAATLLAVVATPSALFAVEATGSTGRQPTTLVVGRVSDDPRSIYPKFESFGTYIVSRLAADGADVAGAVVTSDNAEMGALLRDGKVDILSEAPFSAMEFVAKGLAELLLLEQKRGESSYRSILVTRLQSQIQVVGDLVGKRVAFEDPGSTTGYHLPMLMLRNAGLIPVELPDVDAEVPPDKVGYVFLRAEVNIAAAAASGAVDAGALSNADWQDKNRLPKRVKDRLAIFQISDPVPHSILLVRKSLDPALKARLRDVLLNAGGGGGQDTRQAFKNYYGVTGYGPIDAKLADKLQLLHDQAAAIGP